MELCGYEIYLFCDEDLPEIVLYWILSFCGAFMTILGIILHLFELSWSRTEILEEENLKTKQELEYIQSHVKSILHTSTRASSSEIGLTLLNQTRPQQNS